MISRARLGQFMKGDLVIYQSPNDNHTLYSGRILHKLEGVTGPTHLCLVPTDKRLPQPPDFVTELAYNWGVAFRVSMSDLVGREEIAQNLYDQVDAKDKKSMKALDHLVFQLGEIRGNFEIN